MADDGDLVGDEGRKISRLLAQHLYKVECLPTIKIVKDTRNVRVEMEEETSARKSKNHF